MRRRKIAAFQVAANGIRPPMAQGSRMAADSPILDYAPKPAPPRKLTLEESNGGVRVIFPVFPVWAYWVSIVLLIVVGLFRLMAGLVIGWAIWRSTNSLGPSHPDTLREAHRLIAKIVILWTAEALLFLGLGAYEWCMLHRWGRVPRVLTARSDSLVLSRLGWWRMRERTWPVSEISAIQFRPVKGNLNWKRTIADLYIRRRNARRLWFRLSSSDPQLPARIAEQLAFRLGCPMRH